MNTKYCSGCDKIKDIIDFNKNKSQKDGLANWCRICKRGEYLKNKQHYTEYKKQYIETHKEWYDNYHKEYRKENKEKISELNKNYYKDNEERKEKRRKYMNEYVKNRTVIDKKFQLDRNISRGINRDLKRFKLTKNSSTWEQLVGYTIEDLVVHLEKQFKEGMSWANQGFYWHVDHIKPKSSYAYSSVNDPQFKECWALNNLQPLEKIENLKKGKKYEPK